MAYSVNKINGVPALIPIYKQPGGTGREVHNLRANM